MENIILTNNKDLRLVSVKVGVLSTLRFELPLVSASATHVEVIVTSGNVHSAYTATFIDATKRWQCDIAASQFPTVGKQSYEVAYVLDGKQFWDGKGWIEIEDATTSGIEPQPRPEPYRYAVVSVNGYGADAQGAVRIPKTFIATDSPTTTEGYMEGDIYFNRETGATWTLCNVQSALTWVFNYKNYYTKEETDQQIDRVAAYYITYDAAGNPFPTYAALANAQTVYSGGKVRIPTRNDYCVVLADETHQGAEYRYIYAVAEGQTTGSWQAQFPVEGVMTVDQTVQKNSQNPVSGGGVWSAIWGALAALPTGFSSMYDWCVAQLAGKQAALASGQISPQGSILSVDAPIRIGPVTKVVKLPTTASLADKADSSSIAAVFDASKQGGYAVDDVVMYKGVRYRCTTAHTGAWDAAHFAAQTVEAAKANDNAVVKLTGDQTIGGSKVFTGTDNFYDITISHPQGVGYIRIYASANENRVHIDFSDAVSGSQGELFLPVLGGYGAVTLAAIENLAPDAFLVLYDGATIDLNTLCCYQGVLYRCILGYTFASGDDYPPNDSTHWATATVEDVLAALRTGKADKCVPQAAGNLAALDSQGNPTDSAIPAANVALKGNIPYTLVAKTISNNAVTLDDRASNAVTVSATLSPNTLTINFPTATSGKVRDFAMRLNIAAGVTAPEIAWPQGVTLENDGGEVPEIADGGTGGSSTILYFSETENNGTTAKFLVKGETLTAITQA